jgi:hypothetical protein
VVVPFLVGVLGGTPETFRAAAEPSLAVLSAVAINAAIARMRGGRGRLPAG